MSRKSDAVCFCCMQMCDFNSSGGCKRCSSKKSIRPTHARACARARAPETSASHWCKRAITQPSASRTSVNFLFVIVVNSLSLEINSLAVLGATNDVNMQSGDKLLRACSSASMCVCNSAVSSMIRSMTSRYIVDRFLPKLLQLLRSFCVNVNCLFGSRGLDAVDKFMRFQGFFKFLRNASSFRHNTKSSVVKETVNVYAKRFERLQHRSVVIWNGNEIETRLEIIRSINTNLINHSSLSEKRQ